MTSSRARFPLFLLVPALALAATSLFCFASGTASVPLADGFDSPVGKGGSGVYHRARGFTPNGHLGEDWNGAGGGDTDLGDPVVATAHGLVVFAQDYRLGWGNVVIVRHAYPEDGETKYVDSLYGHLHEIMVSEGQVVKRGQQVGTMGNNRGMYHTHLHFEMRKNLAIGMHRSSYARDFSNYFDPTKFIQAHRQLAAGGQFASVPVNTFVNPTPGAAPSAPAVYAGPVTGPVTLRSTGPASSTITASPSTVPRLQVPPNRTPATSNPRGPFFVDRFSDLR